MSAPILNGQYLANRLRTDDIVAYYTMSDSLDSSSNGRVLTNNNGVTFVSGKVINAGNFVAASAQSLRRADAAFLLTTFTLACWVRIASKPGNEMNLMDRHTAVGTLGYALFWNNGPDQFALRIGDGSSFSDVTWNSSPSLNTWYFLVAWADDAARQFGISVDNGAPITASYVNTIADANLAFRLGEYGPGGSNLDGQLDEAAIWSRILTEDERTYLWNGGNGRTWPLY